MKWQNCKLSFSLPLQLPYLFNCIATFIHIQHKYLVVSHNGSIDPSECLAHDVS